MFHSPEPSAVRLQIEGVVWRVEQHRFSGPTATLRTDYCVLWDVDGLSRKSGKAKRPLSVGAPGAGSLISEQRVPFTGDARCQAARQPVCDGEVAAALTATGITKCKRQANETRELTKLGVLLKIASSTSHPAVSYCHAPTPQHMYHYVCRWCSDLLNGFWLSVRNASFSPPLTARLLGVPADPAPQVICPIGCGPFLPRRRRGQAGAVFDQEVLSAKGDKCHSGSLGLRIGVRLRSVQAMWPGRAGVEREILSAEEFEETVTLKPSFSHAKLLWEIDMLQKVRGYFRRFLPPLMHGFP